MMKIHHRPKPFAWLWKLFLTLGLLLQALYLGLLYFPDSLGVAPYMLERVERALGKQGLKLSVDELSLNPQGVIVAAQGSLYYEEYQDPLLSFEHFVLRFDPFSVLFGDIHLYNIDIREAVLQVPPVYACSSDITLKVRELALRHYRGRWFLDRGWLQLDNINAILKGAIKLSTGKQDFVSLSDICASINHVQSYIPYVKAPIAVADFQDNALYLNALAESFEFNGLSCKYPRLAGLLQMDSVDLSEPIHFSAQDTVFEEHVRADSFWAELPLNDFGTVGFYALSNVNYKLGALHADSCLGRLSIKEKDIQASGLLLRRGEPLTFLGALNFETGHANLGISGRWNCDSIASWIGSPARGGIPELQFASAPFVTLECSAAKDYNFDVFDFFVRGRDMQLNEVYCSLYSLQGSFSDGLLVLHDSHLETADFHVSGSYSHDFRTSDYRMTLSGTFDPNTITEWMDPWWSELWESIDFDGPYPDASVDIRANWLSMHNYWVYGHMAGNGVKYRGVPTSAVELRFAAMPWYMRFFDFYIQRPEGDAFVDMTWIYKGDYSSAYILAFDMESHMDLQAAAGMLDPEVASWVEPFSLSYAPYLKVYGHHFGPRHPSYEADEVHIIANMQEPLQFQGVDLDALSFTTNTKNCHAYIDDLKFELAGGSGLGSIDLAYDIKPHAHIDFNIEVEGLKYEKVRHLATYLAPERKIQKEGSEGEFSGLLSGSVQGKGFVSQFDSFSAEGEFALKEADFGKIHIFGGLSKLLDHGFLGISSLRLTNMAARFELNASTVHFSKLKVYGSAAEMEGKGQYNIPEDRLDFKMQLYLLGGIHIPLVSQVLNTIDPFSKMFGLRVTGPLDEPEWSFIMTPLGLGL